MSSKLNPAKQLRVAIQGVQASFHDVALRKYFKNTSCVALEFQTFGALCKSLKSGDADFGVMAIENTIAGSILTNYGLLEANEFKILGEVYLRIEMCLMALPDTGINDVRYVQSHPMAILQCQEFLQTLKNVQILEFSDTAESAKEIKEKNLKSHAAIASRLAAEVYGLKILSENIETDHQNFTRFIVLCRKDNYHEPDHANKASVRFETEHKPGSLAEVLQVLSDYDVNMTKIQSVPILGKPYQYGFHVDLEWVDEKKYQLALALIKSKVLNWVHFGNYLSGEKPFK